MNKKLNLTYLQILLLIAAVMVFGFGKVLAAGALYVLVFSKKSEIRKNLVKQFKK